MEDIEIIKQYALFSNESIESIQENIQNFKTLNLKDFGKYSNHQEFYELSETYIFDLLSANSSHKEVKDKLIGFIPNFFNIINSHPGNSFLEFGGGLGVLTEIIKTDLDMDVTYVDIKGHISDFAMWRFKEYNININCHIIPQDKIPLTEHYDVIFTDAVIEHLPPKQQIEYTQKLCEFLSPNGMIIFLVDLEGENKEMPMHFNVKIEKLHDIFLKNKLIPYFGKNTFVSIWVKKPFPKIKKLINPSVLSKIIGNFSRS